MLYILYGCLIGILLLSVGLKIKVGYTLYERRYFIDIVIFIMLVLFLFYTSVNAIDSYNYKNYFDNYYKYKISDQGYTLTTVIFRRVLGFNYQWFRMLVGLFYLIPIIFFFRKEREMNVPFFLMLNIIFPFFQSIVALRNTMAATFEIFGLYAIMAKKQRKYKLVGTALLLIGAQFHDTAYIFLLILVIYCCIEKMNICKKSLQILAGIFSVMIAVLLKLVGLDMILVFPILSPADKDLILGNFSRLGLGWIITAALQMGYVWVLNRMIAGMSEESKTPFINNIQIFSIAIMFFIPFYSINILFFRLFRNVLIFYFYVYAAGYIFNRRKKSLIAAIITLQMICMCFDASGIQSIVSILGRIS